jgi:hypothetical protein
MTKEYNRFYEYITSTECYGGFPYHAAAIVIGNAEKILPFQPHTEQHQNEFGMAKQRVYSDSHSVILLIQTTILRSKQYS